MKSSRFSLEAQKRPFCLRYRNRVVIPPASVKAIVAQRGASVANKTVTNRYGNIRRGQEQWLNPRKINPSGLASIAAGIPPAALLVGQKPEPTYGEPPLPIVPPHSPYGQEVQLSAR